MKIMNEDDYPEPIYKLMKRLKITDYDVSLIKEDGFNTYSVEFSKNLKSSDLKAIADADGFIALIPNKMIFEL